MILNSNLAAQAEPGTFTRPFDTSDYIKERIKRYHDYGIGVEAPSSWAWTTSRRTICGA